ncbi:MAG: TVP38/TMEM64 family protein [Nanoarchaeota archaeon]|nr:TVP38/TMEM64 family protein [Nanoarchaeota archaeon]MBU1632471.1 TVP38/TMEM64 family protein [Nanoarchaeota archaeon]MBU1876456.1 TVP38/TMEM64 family protein [Nanoarchaeota archaeon]
MNIKKRAYKLKFLLLAAIIILLYYSATQSTTIQNYINNPIELKDLILGYGILAPIIIILLQTIQSIISIFPSQITTIVSGFIFGPVLGLSYSLIGAFIGSAIIFIISKHYGKRIALRFFDKKDIVHFNMFFRQKNKWALFIARITPIFPNDLVSFTAGLTTIRFWPFCLVSTLGFIIQMVILVYFGAGIVSGKPNFLLYFSRLLVGLLLMVVLFKHQIKKMLIKDVHKLEKEGTIIEKEIEKEFKKI